MRRIPVAFACLALALMLPARASAQEASKAAKPVGEAVTVTAQVVDLSCKFVQNASGPDHKMCAEVCADKGQPLGLLTSDGRFLLPVNAGMGAAGENARLKPYVEQSVTVKGRLLEHNGFDAIVIETIKKS
ncbi:MAG: hypothetical protein ACT443_12700 [Gemmatimonadota bacterium]